MRMCISITGFTMSSPTGMTDSNVSGQCFSNKVFFEFGNFALLLVYIKALTIQQCHTSTVIASVFQSLKPFQDHRVSFFGTYIGYNSTHMVQIMFEGAR